MGEHFRLDVDPVQLSGAEAKLAGLGDYLAQEGASLATLGGVSPRWTGAAATACLGEATRISTTLRTAAAPKLGEAVEAVKAFRVAVESAQDTTARLSLRWEQSLADYDAEVGRAGRSYASEVGDLRNVPDEDARSTRQSAALLRERARSNASADMTRAQGLLAGQYDALVVSLEQAAGACGAALAGLVPIRFTADQWAKVKGGHVGIGLLATLRSQVFSEGSFLHQSDGLKAGEYVAGRLGAQAQNGKPGDRLDREVVDLLDQMKGDGAFAEGLLSELGPGGAAFLNLRARTLFESPFENGDKDQGKELLAILSDLYASGSNVRVPIGEGQSRPLMDQAWLDGFNPESYDQLGESYQGRFRQPTYVHGYRPDLLLPFMNKAGGFSSDFSQLVTQQALADYEKSRPLDADQHATERWLLYRGDDGGGIGAMNAVLQGDASNPFRTELFHVSLERAGEHPFAANAVMTTHRDTMLELMTGKADWLTGADNRHDWASPALAAILKQATIGSQAGNVTSADAALWGAADYLRSHPGEHLVKDVQVALGDVVTDTRLMDGAISSVTSPFGAADGFRDDPGHPATGPLMAEELWAALHQEAMGQPDAASRIIAQVGSYITDQQGLVNALSYRWDETAGDGGGKWALDTGLTFLDSYQAEAAGHFLGSNLKASSEVIKAELERALAQNGKDKEQAKEVLGMMVGWATDPSKIKDDVVGKVIDLAVDKAVDSAMPTDGIHEGYDKQIQALDKMLGVFESKSDPWSVIKGSTDLLIADIRDGNVNTVVEAPRRGEEDPKAVAAERYNGDPGRYIGHTSHPPLAAAVPPKPHDLLHLPATDDFLTYDPAGDPVAVKQAKDMNPAQRAAYLRWLHDPAVQKFVGEKLASQEAAHGLASR